MMFLQVTFSFHFSNFVLGSFLSFINACQEEAMGVISVMKRFVHLLAEGGETIFPTFFPSEVGVVGVKLELYFCVAGNRALHGAYRYIR